MQRVGHIERAFFFSSEAEFVTWESSAAQSASATQQASIGHIEGSQMQNQSE